MDVVLAPSDVHHVIQSLRSVEGNPIRMVGRFAGLGDAEMERGIPGWAWVAVGAAAGAIGALAVQRHLSEKKSKRRR